MSDRARWSVLVAAALGNFGQFGTRAVISPLVPMIVADLGESKASIGVALTLSWAAFAVAQYPSGALGDRYGERRVISVALGTAVVGSALVAAAPTFLAFSGAAVLLGAGAGLYFAVGTSLLDRRFDNTGFPFSVHTAGGPLAGLVLPIIAAAAAARLNWRVGVLVGTLAAAVSLLIFRFVIGPTPPQSPDGSFDRLRPGAAMATLRRPRVVVATLLGAVGIFVLQSFVSFFPTFLQETRELGAGQASAAFSAAFLLIVIANPLVGRLADRAGTATGIAVPMSTAAAGFVLLVTVPGPVGLVGVGLVGAGITYGGPVQSRVMTALGEEGGTGFAISRGVYLLLGSTGSAVTGKLAETAGWSVAIGVVAGLLLLAVAGVLAWDGLIE